MTIFGEILDASHVEAALVAHLQTWSPTYVAEIERQRDPAHTRWPNGLAPIRNYTVVHSAEEKFPEDQLPMILIFSPGLAAPPEYHGGGETSAIYAAAVAAIASADTLANTKAITRAYASAAKAAIVQHEDLGGFALGTRWIDERNYPIVAGVEVERNLMAVSMTFEIEIENVLERDTGPLAPVEPPEEAPPEPPVVKTHEVEIDLERP